MEIVTKPSLILSFSTILELCAHFLYNNFGLLLNPAMISINDGCYHVLTVSQSQSCQFCAYVFYWCEFVDTHAMSSCRCASSVDQLVGWYCGTTRESNPRPLKSRAVTQTTLTLRSCGPPPHYLDNIVFLSVRRWYRTRVHRPHHVLTSEDRSERLESMILWEVLVWVRLKLTVSS